MKDATGCAIASELLLHGEGVEPDQARGLELASRACDGAEKDETSTYVAGACSNAGVLLAGMKPVDKEKVRTYLERGCAIADEKCTNLGVAYADGLIGEKDPTTARGVFTRACEANDPDGCSALGRQLVEGVGGPKDVAKAKELFAAACKAGSKKGCINQKKFP
jgi:uncharacterized protein